MRHLFFRGLPAAGNRVDGQRDRRDETVTPGGRGPSDVLCFESGFIRVRHSFYGGLRRPTAGGVFYCGSRIEAVQHAFYGGLHRPAGDDFYSGSWSAGGRHSFYGGLHRPPVGNGFYLGSRFKGVRHAFCGGLHRPVGGVFYSRSRSAGGRHSCYGGLHRPTAGDVFYCGSRIKTVQHAFYGGLHRPVGDVFYLGSRTAGGRHSFYGGLHRPPVGDVFYLGSRFEGVRHAFCGGLQRPVGGAFYLGSRSAGGRRSCYGGPHRPPVDDVSHFGSRFEGKRHPFFGGLPVDGSHVRHGTTLAADNDDPNPEEGLHKDVGRGSLLTCGDVHENPGPAVTGLIAASANVTSLLAHPEVHTMEAWGRKVDLLALQEVRVCERDRAQAEGEARSRGKRLVWGRMQGQTRIKTALRTEYGGVAFSAATELPARAVPPGELTKRHWEKGRFAHAQVAYGDGRRSLSMMSIYGVVSDEDATEEILADTLSYAATLGDVPILIAGDFNVEPEESPILNAAVQSGKWVDVGSTWAKQYAQQPAATCMASKKGRRIDAIFANSVAAVAISGVNVLTAESIPTHRPVVVRLDLERLEQRYPQLKLPRTFPVADWSAMDPEEEFGMAEKWAKEAAHRYRAAQGVDAKWKTVCDAAEQYLLERSGGLLEKPRQYVGRGQQAGECVRSPAARQVDGEADADDRDTRARLGSCRRLEELVRLGEKRDTCGQPSTEEMRVWRKARRAGVKHVDSRLWEEANPPALPELQALCGMLKKEHERTRAARRTKRLETWRGEMRRAIDDNPKRVYDWCKQPERHSTLFVERGDGSVTADLHEMDEILRGEKAWGGVFQMYKEVREPKWEDFVRRYGKYVKRGACEDRPLTGEDLSATLKKMKARKAGGMDGWRVCELKTLPVPLLDVIALALNDVEGAGSWPEVVAQALVVLIPKGEGPQPLEQRPITITSVMYRLWAATRLRFVREWQESWAHPDQRGFRKKGRTQEVYWLLAAKMEAALLNDEDLFAVAFDYSKCFDRIPQEIMLKLVEDMGLPPSVLNAVRGMYRQLRRRFKLPAGLGKEFKATNGILQGCPLSVIFLNALVSVWMYLVEEEVPGAEPQAFADDTEVVTRTKPDMTRAVALTEEFCGDTGQRPNARKSKWTVVRAKRPPDEEEGGRKRKRKSEAEANPRIAGQEVEKVAWLKCLGAGLGTDGGAQKVLSSRLDEASKIAKRAGKLPLPQEKKERIYASVVIPKAIYGVEVQEPEKKWLAQLTAAIERGLAGRDRRGRCAAISLSLVRKGHLVDPPVAVHYRRVMTWMALMKDSERCRAHMQAAARVFPCPSTSGPVHLLDGTLEAMKWQRTGPWSIRIPDDHTDETETGDGRGKEVDLRTLDDLKELGHLAREALRLWRWRNIDRKNLEGIGEGVDRNATLRLLEVGRGKGEAREERGATAVNLSAYERGVLRHIMADAVLPQTRLHQRKMQPSATCKYCGKEDEDHLHMWWRCGEWDAIRTTYAVTALEWQKWPKCMSVCGIKPKKERGGEGAGAWVCRGLTRQLVNSVQGMMVQITLERQRRDKKPVQRESDGRGLAYPWEWAPQETEVIQNSLADYMPRNWKHGRALYLALAQWLASLRWAKSEEEMAVTFIELAVDFEVESGMDLPRRGQKAVGPEDAEDGEEDAGQKGEAHGGAALAGKMRTLLGMLKTLQGTHDGELLPARKKSIGWLRRLGASGRWTEGLERRCILGRDTLQALRGLEVSAGEYTKAEHGKVQAERREDGERLGKFDFKKWYPSDEERGRRAQKWFTLAEQENQAGRGGRSSKRNTAQGKEVSRGAPEAEGANQDTKAEQRARGRPALKRPAPQATRAARSAKQRKKEDEEIQTAQQDARAEAADGPQRRKAEQERQARSVREAAIADKATSTEQPSRRKAVKRPASQVAQNVGARAAGSGDEVMQDEGEARSPQPGRTNKTQDQATKRRRGTRPRDPG
ncbi:Retrovirus-related Pol polyprotein from type-1 retrotransposable element R2 [Diplonema papillatum]|nr:Retrovirus-related Pol polyprotein from type-1 retrotransposable element R2 [Diplonema papillatum]